MRPPTGLRDAPLWERLVYLKDFLMPTLGLGCIVAACAGVIAAVLRRNYIAILLAGTAVINIIYLGTRPAFLERNFSHVLPLVFLVAGVGAAWLLQGVKAKAIPILVAAGVLVIAAWPAAGLLYTMRFYVLSGGYKADVEAVKAEVQRNSQVPFVLA